MTIIEARELAMQGKVVISPDGSERTADDFKTLIWGYDFVFGNWREKKEPRRLYAIETNGELLTTPTENMPKSSKLRAGERIVEFVELIP